MSIVIVHIVDGGLDEVVTDDPDMRVVLVDEDDESSYVPYRRSYPTTVDAEQASQVWREVTNAETDPVTP